VVILAALLALGALLAGCGGGEEAEEEPPSPPAPATGAETEPAGEVVYRIMGGIDGRDDELVVQPDGSARGTLFGAEVEGVVTADELAEIYRLLDESGLFTENAEFLGDVVDDVHNEISYRGVTVSTDSSAAPDELLPAIARLDDTLDALAS